MKHNLCGVYELFGIFMLFYLVDSCSVHVEKINCTGSQIANVHFTCEAGLDETDCICDLESPLTTASEWYLKCKVKRIASWEKKKIWKRQTSQLGNCRAIQPPRPGKASCTMSSGELICVGACDAGFRFINGNKQQTHSCRYLDGIWQPNTSFPPCEPECIPSCENGGNCTSPNFCSCSNEFRGNACQYPVELCELSKTDHASSWHCNHTRIETSCAVSCYAPGTSEAELHAKQYTCSIGGVWTPLLPSCVRVVHKCEDPGTIDFGHRIVNSTELGIGTSITYHCNTGYFIVGESKITCLSEKKWSADKPKCMHNDDTSEQCPKPNLPKNSLIEISIPTQHSLHTLFNSDLPLLKRLYLTVYINTSNTDVEESDVSKLFSVGTRVKYKCKSRFYKLYGSQYQTCLSSLTWSGYQPACVPECGKSDSPKTPFIVNGNTSRIGQWPWMVAIALKTRRGLQLNCGGVLVSESWVLTAAHCVTFRLTRTPIDKKNLLVYCGKHLRTFAEDDGVQIKQVKQIIIHEEYDFVHFDGDIALLQLDTPVELTTRVQPVCLPTEVITRENIQDGQKGIVLGWGLTENGTFSETLRETVLPVVNHGRCEEGYRQGLRTVTITQNMFCAGMDTGSTDTCIGDSGGPYMFSVGSPNDKRWYLEGLVSWGSETGCAKAQRYSGFTKVGQFVPWINMFI